MNNRDARLIAGKHHGYSVERGALTFATAIASAAIAHAVASKAWDGATNPLDELTTKNLKHCTELTKLAAIADIQACRSRLAILAIKIKDPTAKLRYSNLAEVEDGIDELQQTLDHATSVSHFFNISERAFNLGRKF